jgi:hypothetical protein
VQLAQSRVLGNVVELPSLLVLRGLGHPGWYVVLLLLLTALGVATAFRRTDRGELPPGVIPRPHDKKDGPAVEPVERPDYSGWIMSIATLLPGDVLGYLRNYVYRPSTARGAIGITVFQLLGLFVQGLLVFSVLSLVR